MDKAIITKNNDGIYEARCRNCGRLLFTFDRQNEKKLDDAKQFVIIVSRCTRNYCKIDNEVRIEM